MPTDKFHDFADSPALYSKEHILVVPDDDADLPFIPKAIYVNTSGTAAIIDHVGNEISYNLVAGSIPPIRPTRIKATGTTAELIAYP